MKQWACIIAFFASTLAWACRSSSPKLIIVLCDGEGGEGWTTHATNQCLWTNCIIHVSHALLISLSCLSTKPTVRLSIAQSVYQQGMSCTHKTSKPQRASLQFSFSSQHVSWGVNTLSLRYTMKNWWYCNVVEIGPDQDLRAARTDRHPLGAPLLLQKITKQELSRSSFL